MCFNAIYDIIKMRAGMCLNALYMVLLKWELVCFRFIWQQTLTDDTSASEVQDLFPGVSSSLLPQYSPITWRRTVVVQHPWVLVLTHHANYHTPPKSILSGVSNVKEQVPTILHLQTQDKCKHSTILLRHNNTRFYLTWSTTYF
jgi:hypothetical protein